VSIDVPPDLEERLKAAAKRSGQSVPDYLRSMLENQLPPPRGPESAEERRARVHSIAGKYAGTGVTLEDYFQEKRERTRQEEERDRRRWGEPR
jgi:hypothetical protein